MSMEGQIIQICYIFLKNNVIFLKKNNFSVKKSATNNSPNQLLFSLDNNPEIPVEITTVDVNNYL